MYEQFCCVFQLTGDICGKVLQRLITETRDANEILRVILVSCLMIAK